MMGQNVCRWDKYAIMWIATPGGHSTFFQVGVCSPDFRSVGLANWHLSLKRGACELKMSKFGACELKISKFGGLWAENVQIWGAWELKISKFGGLWAKIWVKIEAVDLKFPNFLKRGSCELTLLLEMGPLRAAGEAWKGGLQGRTSPYPLSRSVPPPPPPRIATCSDTSKHANLTLSVSEEITGT